MPEDTTDTPPQPVAKTDMDLTKRRLMSRFWLAVLALLLAAFLAVLAVGSLAVGHGIATETPDPEQAKNTVLIFEIMAGVFVMLSAGAMWLTYKLRPGGD